MSHHTNFFTRGREIWLGGSSAKIYHRGLMRISIKTVYLGVIALALLLPAQTLKATGTGIEPIYNFNSSTTAPHGDEPTDPLIQANDGNFYGTTFHGGPSGDGTVFK